jgi:Protein of unknown function DUF262/Protein of unknown function (DUF1524)
MARKSKLTNSSDESEIASVLSGDSIFSIPYFQRPYKWKADRIRQFENDILEVVDSILAETPDSHFLGAIIVHGRRRNPSDPTVFDIIDGQQRLTTVFIFIAALVSTYCKAKEISEALGLFQKYLTLGRQSGIPSNIKLHPGRDDRQQINDVLSELLLDSDLRAGLGTYIPSPLTNSGEKNGPLKKNFKALCKFLSDQHKEGGIERIRVITRALLDHISVVQIDVNDPANGPKIFDSLNSQQEPMTIGDLIRNEIFSKVADQPPATVEALDAQTWQPFYSRFKQLDKNLFDSYFFPYGLTQNPNLAKSEVYNYLRESWKDENSPSNIVKQIERYQNAFIDICVGSNLQGHEKTIAVKFRNLFELGLPAATYPFLLHLSDAIKSKVITDTNKIISMLDCTESFLVRRATVGIEPTGLHAVFKRLWSDLDGEYSTSKLQTEIKKHGTVKWPDDSEFQNAISSRSLYGAAITPFLVSQFDVSLGGDQPVNNSQIEHILPKTMSHAWSKIFSVSEHLELKDVLANLVPISQNMNASLSNNEFQVKAARYKADSMFKSAREVAEQYTFWSPSEIRMRSDKLAKWASARWKY